MSFDPFEAWLLVGVAIYFYWWSYRMGYEAGRAFELDAEAARLDAKAVVLKAETDRLEAESKRIAAETQRVRLASRASVSLDLEDYQ